MRQGTLLALVLGGSVLASSFAAPAQTRRGRTRKPAVPAIPSIVVQQVNLEGFKQLLHLDQKPNAAKAKPLLVNFWATWCDPCRAEMPQLVALAARYRARGLDLVTVSCDEPEQEAGAAGFLEKNGPPLPRYIKRAASDEKFIDSVDPRWSGALPALFIYDRQGRLVKSFVGATGMPALEAALKQVL
jgi:thiol-disulfide isomerase/thioredoxin